MTHNNVDIKQCLILFWFEFVLMCFVYLVDFFVFLRGGGVLIDLIACITITYGLKLYTAYSHISLCSRCEFLYQYTIDHCVINFKWWVCNHNLMHFLRLNARPYSNLNDNMLSNVSVLKNHVQVLENKT